VRVLVIAPHPDDETIGAGGTLLRHVANGDEIFWAVVTEAYTPNWSEETIAQYRRQALAAKAFLRAQEVFFCGFPTVRLNTIPYMEISSALQKIVNQVQPEVVYTTSGDDINQDHRIVYECTLVATRPLPGNPVRRLLAYEVAPTARFGLAPGSSGFVPNVFIDIEPYLDQKIEMMSLYKTELREYPHPRSAEGLRLLARERGLGVGYGAAECFQLIRELA
jgi:N-acetylglucosamine malate deacetylase 1